MERLPLEHIRVQDGPQPVIARPSLANVVPIYCYAEDLLSHSGDSISYYDETSYNSLEIPLTASATVFLQCQFNVSYLLETPLDYANVRAWCDILPAPYEGSVLQSPVSSDTRETDSSIFQNVSIGWTAVLTRSETFTVVPHVTAVTTSGIFTQISGNFFLAAIVGADTGADCLTWSSPG